jgi:hypothetical protein
MIMIPYINKFFDRTSADALSNFVLTLPHERQRNRMNTKSFLRRVSYPGWSPLTKNHGNYAKNRIETAPRPVRQFADAISKYACKLLTVSNSPRWRPFWGSAAAKFRIRERPRKYQEKR